MPPPAPNSHPFTYGINFTELSVGYNEPSGSGSIIENAIINSTTMALESSPKIDNDIINGYITSNGTAVVSNNIVTGEIDLTGPSTVLNNHINGSVLVQTDVIGGNIEDSSNLQGTAVISNNVITGGGINGIGISFLTAFTNNIIISGNTISNCSNSGIAAEGIGVIENNLISNNHDGIDIEGQNTITNNTIENNYVGIQQVSNFLSSIAYNNVQNNSYNFFLYATVSGNVNATYNYWGTANQTAISNSIYDNKDESSLGTVNFVPYLTTPNTQAMPNQNVSVTIPTASPSPTPIITTVTLITILVVAVLAVVVSLLVYRRLRKTTNFKSK
jgi:parallel beta-helix repeat protein